MNLIKALMQMIRDLKEKGMGGLGVQTTEDRKRQRVAVLAVGGVVLFFLIYMFLSSGSKPRKVQRTEEGRQDTVQLASPVDVVKATLEEWTYRSEQRFANLERSVQDMKGREDSLTSVVSSIHNQIEELNRRIDQLERTVANLSDVIVKQASQMSSQRATPSSSRSTRTAGGQASGVEPVGPPPGPPPALAPVRRTGGIHITEPTGSSGPSTENFAAVPPPGVPAAATTAGAGQSQQKQRGERVLTAGSFGRVRLLSGVVAPVNMETPVLMEMVSPVITPSRRYGTFRGAFLIGYARGDESSGSAFVRLDQMVFRYEDTLVSVKVSGWLVGPDGRYGLRGRVKDRAGKFIAYAVLASFVSGAGETVEKAYTKFQVTPLPTQDTAQGGGYPSLYPYGVYQTIEPKDALKVAAASGTAEAAQTIARYFLGRANQLVPVVEIDAGTMADVVFLQDVYLPAEMSKGGKG